MNTGRVAAPGRTRTCPHCKSTILESASVCPACQHHLRFDPKAIVERRLQPAFSPLRVESTFRHQTGNEQWEYSVVISIRNDRGEELSRKVIGVGALSPNESRTVTLSVDVFTPTGPPEVERREAPKPPEKKATAPAPTPPSPKSFLKPPK
jgi:hypothetical protein